MESDLDRLLALVAKPRLDREDIAKVLEIYGMDLLCHEGYHWALAYQAQIQNTIVDKVLDFAREELLEDRCDSLLKQALEKIYCLDLLNEDVAELLLLYHGKTGKKVNLKNFYEDYCRAYDEEMGSLPSPRLARQYEKLLDS